MGKWREGTAAAKVMEKARCGPAFLLASWSFAKGIVMEIAGLEQALLTKALAIAVSFH